MPVINPPRIEILDEGASQGYVTKENFVGAGVTAAVAGETATITIAGGGAGASWTTVEANLGSASWRGKFTITDAAISPTSKIAIQQAPGPYTGKGTRADEAEMDPIWCVAEPGSGQATVYWQTLPMLTPIPYLSSGGDGGGKSSILSTAGKRSEFDIVGIRRLGKVKGNVKFLYTVS